MPRFDGTGPEGKGPKTGRGMGKCPQENIVTRGDKMVEGNRGLGKGRGCGGNGRGMGPRNRGNR